MNSEIEKFGEIFIKEVRDRSIRIFDKRIQGVMKDENSQNLFRKVNCLDDNEKQLINELIPQVVDLCMHNMLCMFEEHDDFVISIDEENLNDLSDGLAGELYSADGWISRFSEQRYDEY